MGRGEDCATPGARYVEKCCCFHGGAALPAAGESGAGALAAASRRAQGGGRAVSLLRGPGVSLVTGRMGPSRGASSASQEEGPLPSLWRRGPAGSRLTVLATSLKPFTSPGSRPALIFI